MRRLSKDMTYGSPRSCVLWREDIVELAELIEKLSQQKIRILSDDYEFDTLQELFDNRGPNISKLKVSGTGASVDLSFTGSSFHVYDSSARLEAYSKLGNFFSERSSLAARLKLLLLPFLAPIIAGSVIFAEITYLPKNWLTASLALFFLLLGVVSFMAALFQVIMGSAIRIHNRSKYAHQFSIRERAIRYSEWALAAIVGGAITLVLPHVMTSLRW